MKKELTLSLQGRIVALIKGIYVLIGFMGANKKFKPLIEPLLEAEVKAVSIVPVLLLAFVLLGAAFLFAFLDRQVAEPYILLFLACLSVLGVVALFGFAVGLVRWSASSHHDPLARPYLDNLSDGILISEKKGRILYANHSYGALTGVNNALYVKSPEIVFGVEPDAAEIIYRMMRVVKEGRIVDDEVRLSRSVTGQDGARWYRFKLYPMPSQGGRTSGAIIWQISDITKQREKHENVFQELQYAVDFLDHAPAGFLAIEKDHTISYLNATMSEWLGYDLAEADSEHLKLDTLTAGEGSALLKVSHGEANSIQTEIIDLDLVQKSGKHLPVRFLHRVPFDKDGVPMASRTLVLNRTTGTPVEEDLRALEVRFARFFNTTPFAIASINREGVLTRTNAPFAQMFGVRVQELEGQSTLDERFVALLKIEDQKNLNEALDLAHEGQSSIAPVDIELPGDDERTAQVFVLSVDDSSQGGQSEETALIYVLETTEQKVLERQFSQSQKMQAFGQLAGGVAHDFNNMLQAIIGNADLLLLSHTPGDPSFKFINQIKQNGNRAAALVRHLLAFSRKQTLRPSELALDDVISDLSMTLDRVLGETVRLKTKHDDQLWPVFVDLNQFEQVIINLAVNARDAMEDGGDLTIATSNISKEESEKLGYKGLALADYVACDVIDSGTGIPEDVLPKIFEPFFTTKDIGKGTGLGLSTVYGIIKQTGGYIYPLTKRDEGTTFRILLPRYFSEDNTEDLIVEEQKEEVQEDLTGAATILLVEDEESVRMVASQVLQSKGYKVHEAVSGLDALDFIEETDEPIDLIVSDVVMPEMDGPTLLKELRKTHPDLKVIFVSGYAEDAFSKNLPDNEKFTFLPKPFSLKQLVETVKNTLSTKE